VSFWSAPAPDPDIQPEKKTFWQKLKSFFGGFGNIVKRIKNWFK